MIEWRKLGCIYRPDGSSDWARSHATNPVAEHVGGDVWRIYFSPRDSQNRSAISWMEMDLTQPSRVVREAQTPVLLPGERGSFDDAGCCVGCLISVGAKRYLYYMGWHLAEDVPWRNTIGLAVSDGLGEPFRRWSTDPVLPLNDVDPHSMTYPWVLHDRGIFRMWYGSNLAAGQQVNEMQHVIKYAESDDGVHWRRSGTVAVSFEDADEYTITRPCVLKHGETYRMWFSSRGDSYRIRYAESDDGIRWRRLSEAPSIDVSPDGWDSEMIEYPCVFEHRGKLYLLYCGNGYGQSGFGLAVGQPAHPPSVGRVSGSE